MDRRHPRPRQRQRGQRRKGGQSGDKLVAMALFSIRHTDYGITPMTVLGGGLQVKDTVKVRMRIVASRDASHRH
jgi:hypothetical protein